MTRPASLDAIIEEGERLEKAYFYDMDAIPCRHFYEEHGPRLLAVAKAAVEWERADDEYVNAEPAVQMRRLIDAEAALRAAVRGDAEKGEEG